MFAEAIFERHNSAVNEITVRPAATNEIDDIIRVCAAAWKGIWRGNAKMFRDRIETFPEGGIVVSELNGIIEGYISVQITDEETILCPNWNLATDCGRFTRTHNSSASWVHGAGLALTPKGSQSGLAAELIEYINQLGITKNKRGARFITRIPGYHTRASEMTPEEYVHATHRFRPLDPELRIMARYGFFATQPPQIFTNYVEGGGDPASCGKSVLIERLNPLFQED